MSIQSEIRKLIIYECPNHQNILHGIKNYCWMKERSNKGICSYFTQEFSRCRYFETSVLPLDESLQESYSDELRKEQDGRTVDQRTGSYEDPQFEKAGLGQSTT